MKLYSSRSGFTLIELLMVTIFLIIGGLVLFEFVKSTYGAQDTISGQNSADANARQVIDTLEDELRNSQWCTVAGTPCAVYSGAATSVTFYRSASDSTLTIQYSLSGTSLQKSVDGGAAVTVLTGVQSLAFTYYSSANYDNAITPASGDYPLLGAVGIDATVSVTQLNTYTRRYTSQVKLRNSPLPS